MFLDVSGCIERGIFSDGPQRRWLLHLSHSLSPARSLTVALNSLSLCPWPETAVGVPSWQLQKPITSAKARKSPGTEDAFTFDISTSAVAWEGTCRCSPVHEFLPLIRLSVTTLATHSFYGEMTRNITPHPSTLASPRTPHPDIRVSNPIHRSLSKTFRHTLDNTPFHCVRQGGGVPRVQGGHAWHTC